MNEQEMYEVLVLRKKQGRERKHRVMTYVVVADSPEYASQILTDWRPDWPVLNARSLGDTIMLFGERESLTDAEVAVVEDEGWVALQEQKVAELEIRLEAYEAKLAQWDLEYPEQAAEFRS